MDDFQDPLDLYVLVYDTWTEKCEEGCGDTPGALQFQESSWSE